MMLNTKWLFVASLGLLLLGCGDSGECKCDTNKTPLDSGADMADMIPADQSLLDAQKQDLPALDSAAPDKALPDKALLDMTPPDKALPDKALLDMTPPDMTPPDKALPDKALTDMTPPDMMMPDMMMPDMMMPDMTPPDAFVPDQGMCIPTCKKGQIGPWVKYAFKSHAATTPCTGDRYVSFHPTHCLWVGAILCNTSQYKLFLSMSKAGTFYQMGDWSGSGEDHCALLDPSYAHPCGKCSWGPMISSNTSLGPGWGRYKEDTCFTFYPSWPQYNLHSKQWYKCGVNIP